MSRFLFIHLTGFCLVLLLAGCEGQYYEDATSAPDYDSDYHATFEYSFFSNSSSDDLESFLKGSNGFEDQQEEDEEETTVAMETRYTAGTESVEVMNNAARPSLQDMCSLLWMLLATEALLLTL